MKTLAEPARATYTAMYCMSVSEKASSVQPACTLTVTNHSAHHTHAMKQSQRTSHNSEAVLASSGAAARKNRQHTMGSDAPDRKYRSSSAKDTAPLSCFWHNVVSTEHTCRTPQHRKHEPLRDSHETRSACCLQLTLSGPAHCSSFAAAPRRQLTQLMRRAHCDSALVTHQRWCGDGWRCSGGELLHHQMPSSRHRVCLARRRRRLSQLAATPGIQHSRQTPVRMFPGRRFSRPP